jgi:hypothetical protein
MINANELRARRRAGRSSPQKAMPQAHRPRQRDRDRVELVGTELAHIKPWLRSYYLDKCHRSTYVSRLNRMGAETTRQRLRDVVGWMREAAEAQGLPFDAADAQVAILQAITRVEMNREGD